MMKNFLFSTNNTKVLGKSFAIALIFSLSTQALWGQKNIRLSQNETQQSNFNATVSAESQKGHIPPNHVLCDSVQADSIVVAALGSCTFQFDVINPQNVTSFNWSFGDGSSSPDPAPIAHSYLTNGTFHVRLIVANGCSADTLYTTVSCSDSGLKVEPILSQQRQFKLYPNPVSDILTIQYTAPNKVEKINISDLSGRIINSSTVPPSSGEQKIRLNISKLAPGMYFLTLINGQDRSVVKFVKQ